MLYCMQQGVFFLFISLILRWIILAVVARRTTLPHLIREMAHYRNKWVLFTFSSKSIAVDRR